MNGKAKYSEEAVQIIRAIERLEEKQNGFCRKIDEIHSQMKTQWTRVDDLDKRIDETNETVSVNNTEVKVALGQGKVIRSIVNTAIGVISGIVSSGITIIAIR